MAANQPLFPCKYYNRETGNAPFLRTGTYVPKSRIPFQTLQNSRLTFLGEISALSPVKGGKNEHRNLRRDSDLFGTSKAARRVREGLGNLERATGRVLQVLSDHKGSR